MQSHRMEVGQPPNTADAISEALMARLLPELRKVVEEIATTVAAQTVQAMMQGSRQALATAAAGALLGATSLGGVQAGQSLSVDWTFSNSGTEPWPAGSRLRFLGGRLGPAPQFLPALSESATPVGGKLTVQAGMAAPQELGPCEAQWQLEGVDGLPLSPPLAVQAVVISPARAPFATSPAPLGSPVGAPAQATVPGIGGGYPAAAQSPMMMTPQQPRLPEGSPVAASGASGRMMSTGQRTGPSLAVAMQVEVQSAAASPMSAAPVPVASRRDGTPGVLASPIVHGTPGFPAAMPGAPGAAGVPNLPVAHSIDSNWRNCFEMFFGRDAAPRLRRGAAEAKEEQQRMFKQVWDHVLKNNLAGQELQVITFDETMSRLYCIVVPVGTTRCSMNDLWALTNKIISKYLETTPM